MITSDLIARIKRDICWGKKHYNQQKRKNMEYIFSVVLGDCPIIMGASWTLVLVLIIFWRCHHYGFLFVIFGCLFDLRSSRGGSRSGGGRQQGVVVPVVRYHVVLQVDQLGVASWAERAGEGPFPRVNETVPLQLWRSREGLAAIQTFVAFPHTRRRRSSPGHLPHWVGVLQVVLSDFCKY